MTYIIPHLPACEIPLNAVAVAVEASDGAGDLDDVAALDGSRGVDVRVVFAGVDERGVVAGVEAVAIAGVDVDGAVVCAGTWLAMVPRGGSGRRGLGRGSEVVGWIGAAYF